MTMTKSRISLVFVLIAVLLLSSAISSASPLNELDSERLAVSLVIDTSGSMTRTDPNLLRSQVADTFIELLNPDDYLGIVTFNSQVDLVIPMTRMENQGTRDAIKAQLVGKLDSLGDTDYTSALAAANKQLEELYVADVRKLVIFLTDGRPDPDPINITANPLRMTEYMNSLWNQVSEISKNGYPVYSIGFSEGIDVEILNRLASDTGGDVRIFRDSAELDVNLIQILKSREQLVQELLAPAIIQASGLKPALNNEFWPKSGGYRLNESESAVASIAIGNRVVGEGLYLKVNTIQLVIERADGITQTIDLLDNGDPANDDVRAGDGRWSNRVIFDEEYDAKIYLISTVEYRGETYSLTKDLGETMVAMPGTINLSQKDANIWVRKGNQLVLPFVMDNLSPFKEIMNISIIKGEGELVSTQLEVSPNTKQEAQLFIQLPDGIDNGLYEYELSFVPLYSGTAVTNSELTFNVEVVGLFGSIAKTIEENIITAVILLGLFVVLPVLVYLLGLILYGILVSPATKLRGSIKYWKTSEPETIKEINLKKLKNKTAVLSFDSTKKASGYLESNRYNYDIKIDRRILIEGKKFILGWKRLFSKKSIAYTVVSCSQPGILEHNGGIATEMKLYDGVEFSSGGYNFLYSIDKSRRAKDDEAGRDILEGRTNGI